MKRSIILLITFATLVFAGSALLAQEALCGSPLANRAAGHLQVKTDRVVVAKWGHMRKLKGLALVPALILPGVDLDEIN